MKHHTQSKCCMRILSSLILLLSGIAGGGSQAQPVPTEPPTVARPAARRLSVSWLSAAGGCIAHGGNAGSYVDSWHTDPTVCQFECAAEPACFGVQESDHSRGHRCRKMLSQPTGAIPLGGASCFVKDTAETRRVWRGRIEIVAPAAASPAASPSASAGGCALSQDMIQGSFASCYFELKTMDNIDMTVRSHRLSLRRRCSRVKDVSSYRAPTLAARSSPSRRCAIFSPRAPSSQTPSSRGQRRLEAASRAPTSRERSARAPTLATAPSPRRR